MIPFNMRSGRSVTYLLPVLGLLDFGIAFFLLIVWARPLLTMRVVSHGYLHHGSNHSGHNAVWQRLFWSEGHAGEGLSCLGHI